MPIMKSEGNVDACPVTKETWETRAELKRADCGGLNLYHCLADNNGSKWEKCLEKTLIPKGNCPVFTSDGFLDWKACNTSEASCPNNSYISNEVYKYPVCFGDNKPRNQILGSSHDTAFGDSSLGVIIGVVLTNLLIIGAAILAFLIIRRRLRRKRCVYEKTPKGLRSDLKVLGVAKQKTVSQGVNLLLKKDTQTLFITGQYGNSVFSTSSSILKSFAKKKNWKAQQFIYTDVPGSVEDKTVIKVYGWFGTWHDDLCSLETVKTVCQKLLKILNEVPDVKFIIEMTSDKYEKYRTDLDPFKTLFIKSITLGNCYRDVENIQHFKKTRRSCKLKKCPCKELTLEMLHEGEDTRVGMLLKMNIIANHHNRILIRNYCDGNYDILDLMKNYINALERNENTKQVYEWISYVCLKGHFSTSEEFDKNLVAKWNFSIQKDDFEKHKKLKEYFRLKPFNVEPNDVYVFWHPFIYICAFHSLFEKHEVLVMESCNIEAIVELVRPEGSIKNPYIEVSANAECADRFYERLRHLSLVDKYNAHPLVQCNHVS